MLTRYSVFCLLITMFFISACGRAPVQPAPAGAPAEVALTLIPLTEPASKSQSEFSGMAWYDTSLILLPQYPSRFQGGSEGALLALPRQEIVDFLDARSNTPLSPRLIPFNAPGLLEKIDGFEGFEAIAFHENQVYLTIEARGKDSMLGYILRGSIQPDLSAITMDLNTLTPIQPQARLDNMSDEALVVTASGILSFYEANGKNINPQAVAHVFDFDLHPLQSLPVENIEYRVTDAAAMDESGQFWVINYLFPDDAKKLKPAADSLAENYGEGSSHAQSAAVERLVLMQYSPNEISLVDTPPIQLELLPPDEARNWEGLVLLPGRGFLLVTDKFPTTLLGFVPWEMMD